MIYLTYAYTKPTTIRISNVFQFRFNQFRCLVVYILYNTILAGYFCLYIFPSRIISVYNNTQYTYKMYLFYYFKLKYAVFAENDDYFSKHWIHTVFDSRNTYYHSSTSCRQCFASPWTTFRVLCPLRQPIHRVGPLQPLQHPTTVSPALP